MVLTDQVILHGLRVDSVTLPATLHDVVNLRCFITARVEADTQTWSSGQMRWACTFAADAAGAGDAAAVVLRRGQRDGGQRDVGAPACRPAVRHEAAGAGCAQAHHQEPGPHGGCAPGGMPRLNAMPECFDNAQRSGAQVSSCQLLKLSCDGVTPASPPVLSGHGCLVSQPAASSEVLTDGTGGVLSGQSELAYPAQAESIKAQKAAKKAAKKEAKAAKKDGKASKKSKKRDVDPAVPDSAPLASGPLAKRHRASRCCTPEQL